MSEMKEAGQFDLEKFEIISYDRSKTVDIKMLIQSFNITESMSKGSVRGSVTLHETAGFIHNFPLRGEEFIEITYKDFFDVKRTDKFFLYSITNVKPALNDNQAQWSYTIHFVSTPKVYIENEKITRAYRGKAVHEYVHEIFDEFYKPETDKQFEAIPTDGPQTLIVPNYTPEQAMYFFARKAYAVSSFSQTFRFFENREKYWFATNEHFDQIGRGGMGYGHGLVDPGFFRNSLGVASAPTPSSIPFFGQIYQPSYSPEGQMLLMNSIVDIDYGEIVNTVADINSGAFSRAYYEMDVMYNVINKIDYNYRDEFSMFNNKQKLLHTDRFIDERISTEKERWAVKDYSTEGMPSGPGIRKNTFYSEIYNRKPTHFYHTESNKTECTIYGRNTIFAGSLVDLYLVKHESQTDEIVFDTERSGIHLVESIDNIFHENIYYQKLTLIRNGIGDDRRMYR